MFESLPWLPRPSDAEAQQLQAIKRGSDVDVVALQRLAGRRWSPAEFRAIGRKLRSLADGHEEQQIKLAQSAELIPVKLLLITSDTSKHLIDFIVAAGLQAGLLIDCEVVEYEAPEAWLARAQGTGTDSEPKRYDAILISLNLNNLQLKANIGAREHVEDAIRDSIKRIDALSAMVRSRLGSTVIIQNLAPDPSVPQSSMDAWLPGSGRYLQESFNRALADLCQEKGLLVFDVAAIASLVGQNAYAAGRYWYLAKYPFAEVIAPLYASRLVQILAAMNGRSRRVLILDLDNTIWGGIIGDDGIEGISVGSGSAVGEAHLAVQRMALGFWERGILLCIASKNTDEVARAVFRQHPDMLLREEHIALFSINWNDKASNIREIAKTLNLGLHSLVFLDDNPAERKQVRDALPAVGVPEVPQDPSDWLPVFQAAAYFEQTTFSAEDKERTQYYQANAQRAVRAAQHGDLTEYLKSLNMILTVAPFDAVGRARIVQLISKSNQFNLTTRRYNEVAVQALENDPSVVTMQIRLADTFGDNGMICVVIARAAEGALQIDTWLMSCRVLGRGVEQATLRLLVERARARGLPILIGRYIPTAKNDLVRDHYEKLGFAKVKTDEKGETVWRLDVAGYADVAVPMQIVDFQQDALLTDASVMAGIESQA